MQTRKLGTHGPAVSAIGLGCMGMSEFYGKTDDAESEKVLLKALEQGITMLDTADMYGFGHNEELIGRTLSKWKGEVFLATKCGIVRKRGEYARSISNRPDYIRSSLEGSLKRLKRDHIDLYYLHRLDASTPLEDSIGELSRLIEEGKIRHIGLSEISASTLEKAERIHHITAVQSEYSLCTRGVEESLIPALKKAGTALVPYSPIGRGLLSGTFSKEDFGSEGDLRKALPRTGEKFEENMLLVEKLGEIASSLGITPAQTALAWVLSKWEHIVPIPGTKRERYLLENIKASDTALDAETVATLDLLFAPSAVQGARYTPEGMTGIEQ